MMLECSPDHSSTDVPSSQMNSRSSKAEIRQRIGEVCDMLLQGYPTRSIVQYSSEKWSLGRRQSEKYISAATRRIEACADENNTLGFAKAVARLEMLFRMALVEEKDLKTALHVTKELNALQGLYRMRSNDQLSPEEFARRFREEQIAMVYVTTGNCENCAGAGCRICTESKRHNG